MQPDTFEQSLLNAAVSASRFHIKMTRGEYLWKSHESFLQNYIAIYLHSKMKYSLSIDYSPKNISRRDSRFKSQTDEKNQRFDLVCWEKEVRYKVKAIIEIKKWRGPKDVFNDAIKISEYFLASGLKGLGYVLFYQDFKRDSNRPELARVNIEKKFNKVHSYLRAEAPNSSHNRLVHGVGDYICDNNGQSDPWGVALYRVSDELCSE